MTEFRACSRMNSTIDERRSAKHTYPFDHLRTDPARIRIAWFGKGNNDNPRSFLQNECCSIVLYSSIRKCIRLLRRIRSRDYVIVVMLLPSVESLHKMLQRCLQYRIAQVVYIVSTDTSVIERFSSSSNNVVVFHCEETMLDHLQRLIEEIRQARSDGGLFTTFAHPERALKDLRSELSSFHWSYVCKGQLKLGH